MNTEIENLKKDVNSIVAFLASNTHVLIKNSDLIAQIVNRQPTQPEGYRGTFAEVVKETELQEYKKTHQLVNPLKDSSDKELTEKEALIAACEIISYAKSHTPLQSINNHDINKVYAKITEMYIGFNYDRVYIKSIVSGELYTDKELLKECSELLYNLYNGIWNGEKISPMLTKLNKHLNHVD